jgi:uroporphyrinogen decarboxylase
MINVAARIGTAYGRAFAGRGLGVTVFDSQASPGLIAPSRFAAFVLEPTRRLIGALKSAGMSHVPYVIGGNTDTIVGDYAAAGGNYILCDGPASPQKFLDACRTAGCAYRRNIPSDLIASGTVEEIRERAAAEIALAGEYAGFILGTGVIAYGTPTDHILAVREARTMSIGGTA